MFKIGIIEKIHEDGIKILDKNPNFEFDIIEDISKENLTQKLPKFEQKLQKSLLQLK